MSPIDKTAPSQTEALTFEFDLPHAPEKVWRALTEPALLAEWLLPVVEREPRSSRGPRSRSRRSRIPGGTAP